MTDETEELTMAQTCRVYAASGMSVSFTPEKLNKLADAIEGAEVMLAEAAEGLEKAEKINSKAMRYLVLGVATFIVAIVLAVLP